MRFEKTKANEIMNHIEIQYDIILTSLRVSTVEIGTLVISDLMDWKIFFTTFVTIFVAEIGDKTQFAAMAAASQTKSILPVLIAVVIALGAAGSLGVLGGRVLAEFLDPKWMKLISGGLFILMGAWILWRP